MRIYGVVFLKEELKNADDSVNFREIKQTCMVSLQSYVTNWQASIDWAVNPLSARSNMPT
jgi:hypothetical protein